MVDPTAPTYIYALGFEDICTACKEPGRIPPFCMCNDDPVHGTAPLDWEGVDNCLTPAEAAPKVAEYMASA